MKSVMELLGELAGMIFSPAEVPTGKEVHFCLRAPEVGAGFSGQVTVLRPWEQLFPAAVIWQVRPAGAPQPAGDRNGHSQQQAAPEPRPRPRRTRSSAEESGDDTEAKILDVVRLRERASMGEILAKWPKSEESRIKVKVQEMIHSKPPSLVCEGGMYSPAPEGNG
jgi:hypothetical protein